MKYPVYGLFPGRGNIAFSGSLAWNMNFDQALAKFVDFLQHRFYSAMLSNPTLHLDSHVNGDIDSFGLPADLAG